MLQWIYLLSCCVKTFKSSFFVAKVCESNVKDKWKAIWQEDNFPSMTRSISCSVWFTAKPSWSKCQNGIYFRHQNSQTNLIKIMSDTKIFIIQFILDTINPGPFCRDKSWLPFLFITQLSVKFISASAAHPPRLVSLRRNWKSCSLHFFLRSSTWTTQEDKQAHRVVRT